MDDILFGNNNQATINRLAKRSYRANKQRNVFVTIALFLTAFMITSVFSLGCSYFETYQMQQIRAMGTTADVAITSLSEEQYEELSRSSLVSVVGVSQRLGSIDTSGMDDALLSITWIDETEWQEHRVPTISDIHGDYPQAKNEIMLPTWALRAMGIDDPQIGMNISLSYQLGTDYQYISDEFVLSGYYTDYSTSRVGNRGSAYISELFAAQTELSFDTFAKEYKVNLKGELGYSVSLGTDTFGNITRLDNALEGLPKRLEINEQELENVKTQFETAKVDVEKPFNQEEELKTKTARLNELNALLNVDKRENEIVGGEPDEGDEEPTPKSKDRER